MTWRPIKSAPHDGTDILVYCEDSEDVFRAFWNGSRWIYGYTESCKPTHWTPLPPPPQKVAKSVLEEISKELSLSGHRFMKRFK